MGGNFVRPGTYKGHYQEWIDLYKQGMSLRELADKYKCSVGIIWHTLNRYGVDRRSRSEAVRKYEITNEGFFNVINDERKSYWLGFMMADGCVRIGRKKDKTVSISLQSRDSDHLVKFKEAIGTAIPIQCYHYEYRHDLARVQICSSRLFDDLVSHGCIPNKSLVVEFPRNIPGKLYRHFIRGYFDGDGWVSVYHTFGIVGGESMLISIREIFHRFIGLNVVKFVHDKQTDHILRLQYRGRRQFSKIYRWLYDDSTVWLDRKRRRFEELMK